MIDFVSSQKPFYLTHLHQKYFMVGEFFQRQNDGLPTLIVLLPLVGISSAFLLLFFCCSFRIPKEQQKNSN
jgi:hypothetical protein